MGVKGKGMRIQFASDLHLEKWRKTTPDETLQPVAPILALLGDVAPLTQPNLLSFLEWCSERWETILWIPGNAEVWNSGEVGYNAAVGRMKQIASSFANVHVLDREAMMSEDGVMILACPLWYRPVDNLMLRYHEKVWVKAEPPPTDPDVLLRCYEANVNWLKEKIQSVRSTPIVVLSYYAPLSWALEEEWIQNPEFATSIPELEQLMREPMVAWVFGHCHRTVEHLYSWSGATGHTSEVFLTSNPRGFPEDLNEFRKEAVLRIDPDLYKKGFTHVGPYPTESINLFS